MKIEIRFVKRCLVLAFVGILCLWVSFGEVMAVEKFPEKPIKLVVGYSPGGMSDLTTRMLAGLASEYLGQPVVVVNKPGASASIGAAEVATSKPDGYTLGSIVMGPYLLSPFLLTVNYDPLKSLEPLLEFTAAPYGICVLNNAPWESYRELIEFARKNPGKLSVSTAGVGTNQHIAFEWIAKQEKIQWKHVPYPGGAPASAALLGGHVKATFGSGSHTSFVESGKFRLLASYSDTRYSVHPKVPTLKELGYDVPPSSAYFIAPPKGVPEPILKTLEDAFGKAANSQSFKKFLQTVYMEPEFRNREQLRTLIGTEYKRWREIMENLDLKIK